VGADSPHVLAVPSHRDLEVALSRFNADWGLVDQVLYGLCREHPGHDDLRTVTAMLALVGRVYAAGLERRVTPPPGQQAIVVIAHHVLRHGAEVDAIIQALHSVREPLDFQSMGLIVEQHGHLNRLLQKVATDGKAPRSFSSKYLHFHNPVIPIYDEYTRQSLSRMVPWERSYTLVSLPPHGDREYWRYCVRFLRLYEACEQAGLDATVKTLDSSPSPAGGPASP
jgi:hypothetical protein